MMKENLQKIIDEFHKELDEISFTYVFSSEGIINMGKSMTLQKTHNGQNIWLGSNIPDNPVMHARMNIDDFIKNSSKDGYFCNIIARNLLCTIYSLWDEKYRHTLSEILGVEPKYIESPIMGDLRKIRHCIIHQKSRIPPEGFKFEILNWEFPSNELEIKSEMFRKFMDDIKKMRISVFYLPPKIKENLHKMIKAEKKSFDDFYKSRENRISKAEWPGLKDFIKRISVGSNKEL